MNDNQPNEFGTLISQKIASESDTFYHHYDALGSTAALTDSSEVVTDEYAFEAFGETAAESGATPNPYQWVAQVGYRKDDETSLYDLRRRNYDVSTGRFVSEDPVRSDEENLYRYVRNEPVRKSDPSGLQGHSDDQSQSIYSMSYDQQVEYIVLNVAALNRQERKYSPQFQALLASWYRSNTENAENWANYQRSQSQDVLQVGETRESWNGAPPPRADYMPKDEIADKLNAHLDQIAEQNQIKFKEEQRLAALRAKTAPWSELFNSKLYGQTTKRCISCHNPVVMSGGSIRDLPLSYQRGASAWLQTGDLSKVDEYLEPLRQQGKELRSGSLGAVRAVFGTIGRNISGPLIKSIGGALGLSEEQSTKVAAAVGGVFEAGIGVVLLAPTWGASGYLILDGSSQALGQIDEDLDVVGMAYEKTGKGLENLTGGVVTVEDLKTTRGLVPLLFTGYGGEPIKIPKVSVKNLPGGFTTLPNGTLAATTATQRLRLSFSTVGTVPVVIDSGIASVTILQMTAASSGGGKEPRLPPKGTPERAEIEAARKKGIREKMAQELADIRAGGKGSGVWTEAELKQIRETGVFPKDVRWHHDPTVANRPDLADDPTVVHPVRGGTAGHLEAHGGNWRKPYTE